MPVMGVQKSWDRRLGGWGELYASIQFYFGFFIQFCLTLQSPLVVLKILVGTSMTVWWSDNTAHTERMRMVSPVEQLITYLLYFFPYKLNFFCCWTHSLELIP